MSVLSRDSISAKSRENLEYPDEVASKEHFYYHNHRQIVRLSCPAQGQSQPLTRQVFIVLASRRFSTTKLRSQVAPLSLLLELPHGSPPSTRATTKDIPCGDNRSSCRDNDRNINSVPSSAQISLYDQPNCFRMAWVGNPSHFLSLHFIKI